MPTTGQWMVLYSGHVQGVGFRYTAARLAERHAIQGYVKNLRDGRVQLVAEGNETTVMAFLQDVRSTMGDNIQAVQTTSCPPTNEFDGFSIQYGS